MPELKMARMLLDLAEEDMSVLNLLLEEEYVPIRPSGFHAQQAVEKALKAWLVLLDEDYPLTHSLFTLLELIGKIDEDCSRYSALSELTPYAVVLRYDSEALGAHIDPATAAPLIKELISHVRKLLMNADAVE